MLSALLVRTLLLRALFVSTAFERTTAPISSLVTSVAVPSPLVTSGAEGSPFSTTCDEYVLSGAVLLTVTTTRALLVVDLTHSVLDEDVRGWMISVVLVADGSVFRNDADPPAGCVAKRL